VLAGLPGAVLTGAATDAAVQGLEGATEGRPFNPGEMLLAGAAAGGGRAVGARIDDRLVKTSTQYETRADARGALAGDQQVAANRFFKGATGKSRDFRVTIYRSGRARLQFFSPARNPGYGKLYVQDIDERGGTVRRYKDTMGPEGLIERKWLRGED
jgi:hypothetical protein